MVAISKPMKPWKINVSMTQRTRHVAHISLTISPWSTVTRPLLDIKLVASGLCRLLSGFPFFSEAIQVAYSNPERKRPPRCPRPPSPPREGGPLLDRFTSTPLKHWIFWRSGRVLSVNRFQAPIGSPPRNLRPATRTTRRHLREEDVVQEAT